MLQIRTCAPLAVLVLGLMVVPAWAQPGGGRGPGGFGGGGFGGGDILNNADVLRELGIEGSQLEELREAQQKVREQAREIFQNFRDMSEEDRREAIAKIRTDTESALKSMMRPNQWERLQQLQLQMRVRFGGISRALASDEMKEKIGISTEQVERLQTRAEELNKELEENIAKLREETRNKLLDELTPSQRANWDRLFGEPAEFNLGGGFGQGGRTPGGAGGPGGTRPGGPGAGGGRFQRGGQRGGERGGDRPARPDA